MRFLALSLTGLALFSVCLFASAQEKSTGAQQPDLDQDLAAMLAEAQKYMKPGEHHELLKKFLGDWNTETRMFMAGQTSPPSKGTSKGSWLIDGRWIKVEGEGSLMGMPNQSFMILGYDNFKMSYVVTNVQSMDTAMTHSEGDLAPSGDVLITYGTLDEYLTGENDKMVKYIWRFKSDDEIVVEIHDLAIGEDNTKVLEIKMTRAE